MKRFYILIVATVASCMLLFTGCGSTGSKPMLGPEPATISASTEDSRATELEPSVDGPEITTPSGEVVAYNPLGEPSTLVGDPRYEALVTSPELCQELQGYYVLRNRKYYKIGGEISYDKIAGLDIGSLSDSTTMTAILYRDWSDATMTSMGDIPILSVSDTDTLVRYGSDKAILSPVSTPTPTVRIGAYDNFLAIYKDASSAPDLFYKPNISSLQLAGPDGITIFSPSSMPIGLSYGQTYKLLVTASGQDYKYNLVADSWLYERPGKNLIILEGAPVGSHYEFDLDNVTPGLYQVLSSSTSPGNLGVIWVE